MVAIRQRSHLVFPGDTSRSGVTASLTMHDRPWASRPVTTRLASVLLYSPLTLVPPLGVAACAMRAAAPGSRLRTSAGGRGEPGAHTTTLPGTYRLSTVRA